MSLARELGAGSDRVIHWKVGSPPGLTRIITFFSCAKTSKCFAIVARTSRTDVPAPTYCVKSVPVSSPRPF